MTLRPFIDETDTPERSIAVVGDAPGPLETMLEETFETQSIDVRSDADTAIAAELTDTLESDDDTAVLLEDGTPVATSPMAELYETILAINSDLFVTGARGLGEIELPDVLAGLEDSRLQLRGYPLAHKEKLLLILLSRRIEQLAWNNGGGTLRSSFQRLSRIDDEVGTRAVYDELTATDVDVHVYGVDDGATPIDLDVTVHSGTTPTYRNAWFVVHRPKDPDSTRGSALVCLETEPRVWDGFWTDDLERVAAIDDAIDRDL
ncbi:histidine kinase [Natronorubrum sp. JWXQ-INN-674]|uniref:Histidine kinase n=1 Tax=Natronorubrum halalkaliphilum TaxID=2691917 RepID=A0A6B0VJE2_9EURY|nr:histidine kinase [Natronorubrum halalkaliphilum]MXV61205.1 histidine kinase [Natronorubrum halalkaliphilum]